MKRRSFLKLVGAVGILPVRGADAPRIARIGLMTDTHVGTTMESCARVRKALELFRSKGVEMVLNCGDLADQHYLEGYRCYRRTVDEVFPDAASRPKEVYVYASHDVFNYRPGTGWNSNNAAAAYEEMRGLLGDPNGHTCTFTWKGLPFAVFPQEVGHRDFLSWDDCEKTVARLCTENPGRPVFVCAHVPPAGTTFHSCQWGNENLRRILDRYPQVVSISGHVHGSLASERQIWQGGFTAINLGCLQTWGGFAAGSTPPPQAKPNFGVLVMDVYRDRLVVYRHDVRDGSECGVPWVVPLPFEVGTAPYAPAAAARRTTSRPDFPPDAAVEVAFAKGRYVVSFPEASTGSRAFMYRIVCARRGVGGAWEDFTRDDVFGDFWVASKDRTGRASYALSPGFFAPGETYRVMVVPLDWFYRPSRAVSCTFTAAHAAPKVVWSASGADAFAFTEHGRKVARDADGFFAPASGQGTLVLPANAFASLERGRPHRFVFDVHTRQPDVDYLAWRMWLAPANAWNRALATIQTSSGDPGRLRYVMEFTPGDAFPASCNVICGNVVPNGRIKPVAAKIEVDE